VKPELTCYQRAVRLLVARPHFRNELALKLALRGVYAPVDIEAALDRLTAEGHLDDVRAARDFVAYRLRKGGEGRLKLLAELQRRGATKEAIEAAMAQVPEDDLDAARQAAEKWARGRTRKDRAALVRHLERKGFSRRAIFAVSKPDELPDGDPDGLLDGDLGEDSDEDL
jgi:regulatory protein